MNANPFFSVITATYKRGSLIKPTIESVLGQTERDFQYLVVGDGCTDETEAAVRGYGSEKMQWHNLPENRGSQSFANNYGIARASGKWICYLGHDDIWAPDHLSRMRETIEQAGDADFVIGGLADWGPPDSGWISVTGIFDSNDAVATNFTPPSSISHRRDVIDRVGAWRDPLEIPLSVDTEFLLRAYKGGMRFVSTKRVTVHKFTSGLRYLSYLSPSDAEQQAALAMLRAGTMADSETIIEQSKERGLFMKLVHQPPVGGPGSRFKLSRENRGLRLPPLRPLQGEAIVDQDATPRAGDWESKSEKNPGVRRSWINPRPKILIPFHGGAAEFEIDVRKMPSFSEGERLRILLNGEEAKVAFEPEGEGGALGFSGPLKENDYSVITLLIAPPPRDVSPRLDKRKYDRITIGDVRLRPAKKRGLLQKMLSRFRKQN